MRRRPLRRRSPLLATIAFASVIGMAFVAPAVAGPTPEQLLPNIEAQPAFGLDVVKPNGIKLLRFSTVTPNIGTGPLEMMRGIKNDCDHDGNFANDRTARQRIFLDGNDDGEFTRGVDTAFDKVVAGCFFFHAIHNHWHFEDFANYRLTRLSDGGGVASRTKVGFCMVDSSRTHPELPGSPSSRYFDTCTTTQPQGISIGWEDLYSAQLDGQNVPIGGVPDGKYCVRQNIDPNNRLTESNDDDNRSTRAVRIEGMSVTPLSRAC